MSGKGFLSGVAGQKARGERIAHRCLRQLYACAAAGGTTEQTKAARRRPDALTEQELRLK